MRKFMVFTVSVLISAVTSVGVPASASTVASATLNLPVIVVIATATPTPGFVGPGLGDVALFLVDTGPPIGRFTLHEDAIPVKLSLLLLGFGLGLASFLGFGLVDGLGLAHLLHSAVAVTVALVEGRHDFNFDFDNFCGRIIERERIDS
jgi:hypothetical protein